MITIHTGTHTHVCCMHTQTPTFLRTFPLQEQWLSEGTAAQDSAVLHSEVEGKRSTTLSPLRGEGHAHCALLSSKLMLRRIVYAVQEHLQTDNLAAAKSVVDLYSMETRKI